MLYRVHEWVADRVRFVQYPRVRRVSEQQRPGRGLWTKVGLALLGVPLFVIGVAGMAACLYFLYVLVSSLGA